MNRAEVRMLRPGWHVPELAKGVLAPGTRPSQAQGRATQFDQLAFIQRFTAFFLVAILIAGSLFAQCPGVPWPATDALGRSLPVGAEAGPPRSDRIVAMFYFLWHDQTEPPVHDISRILAADPGAMSKPASPLWGKIGTAHYWGEPLYGYYRSDDPWVLRRHAVLLADAGVDVLIFDATNAVTYRPAYMKLCEVFAAVRRTGGRTPQIAFMVNTAAGQTAQEIYRDLYKPNLYSELWFRWQGKPLMVCDPKEASPELRAFFTLRRAHWPFTMVNTPLAWHWEAAYPQPYGYASDPAKPEQVNVSVAQNLRASDGKVTNMSDGDARGRSFHDGREDRTNGAVDRGLNFQEQWQRAFALAPPLVMVTGWNEWIAGRFSHISHHGPFTFVDQLNQEYSRDIEPMRGGHGDNYYYQLAANVRRYKGVPPLPAASPAKTISIAGDFDQWRDVRPEFTGHLGTTAPRDYAGTFGTHYADRSGRNNFALMKVADDEENYYFYARTAEAIVPAADAAGMWLLIDSGHNAGTGWAGYDFIVNRQPGWLEANIGGWNWKKVAKVACRIAGREMHLAIPKTAIGRPAALDFKWVDNLQRPGDVMDFYLSGDVAPPGRFNFRYQR